MRGSHGFCRRGRACERRPAKTATTVKAGFESEIISPNAFEGAVTPKIRWHSEFDGFSPNRRRPDGRSAHGSRLPGDSIVLQHHSRPDDVLPGDQQKPARLSQKPDRGGSSATRGSPAESGCCRVVRRCPGQSRRRPAAFVHDRRLVEPASSIHKALAAIASARHPRSRDETVRSRLQTPHAEGWPVSVFCFLSSPDERPVPEGRGEAPTLVTRPQS